MATDRPSAATVAGAGNILSGNGGHGIFAATVDHLTIQGNRIGVGATGGALGNGGDGIGTGASASSVSHLTIGSATNPIAANIIANNAYGIRIVAPILGLGPVQNAIRGNSIYDNVNEGIWIADTTNEVARPLIGSLGPVHGTACALCFVDVFSDHADEGRVFEGTVQADNIGVWTFSGLFAGPLRDRDRYGCIGQHLGVLGRVRHPAHAIHRHRQLPLQEGHRVALCQRDHEGLCRDALLPPGIGDARPDGLVHRP